MTYSRLDRWGESRSWVSPGHWRWYAGIVAIFACLTGAGVWAGRGALPERDGENCLTAAPLPAHTIILLDQTDTVTPTVLDRFREAIRHEALSIDLNAKVTALRLNGENARDPILLFSRCRPERPDEVDELRVSPSELQAYEVNFLATIDEALEGLSPETEYDWTPLADTIYELSVRPDFSESIATRRLILISDLIENHSPEFSFIIDSKLTIDKFEQKRPNFRYPDLNGVDVVLLDVFHDLESSAGEDAQTAELSTFWDEFLLERSNAKSVIRRNF